MLKSFKNLLESKLNVIKTEKLELYSWEKKLLGKTPTDNVSIPFKKICFLISTLTTVVTHLIKYEKIFIMLNLYFYLISFLDFILKYSKFPIIRGIGWRGIRG